MTFELAQQIATVVGAGCVGLWTVITYQRLGLERRAREEEQLRQRELYAEAVVQVDLHVDRIRVPHDEALYVCVLVQMTNKGRRKTYMDYRKTTCGITRLEFNAQGKPVRSTTVNADSPAADVTAGTYLPVGYVHEMRYLARIASPGLYVVDFRNELTREEMDVRKVAGETIPPGTVLTWGTQTIAAIPEGSESPVAPLPGS